MVLSQIATISYGSSYMAVSIPVVLIVLWILAQFYLLTSQQLRILDIELKAPIYTRLTETNEGLMTIRAFGWQEAYKSQFQHRIDESKRAIYMLFMVQRWLNFVLDLIIAGLATLLMTLATQLRTSMDAAALGVGLSSIIGFSALTSQFILAYTELENSLGAVARIEDCVDSIESEDARIQNNTYRPQDLTHDWSCNGEVNFSKVTVFYHDQEKPALSDISFRVLPGQKVLICGRTGSGKSTLISALLRLADLHGEDSQISIGGIDIATVPAESVRGVCVVIPQTPFFLPGSVRLNLAVSGSNVQSDETMKEVLAKVGLWELIRERGGLEADMALVALSHGHQQLFCLAAAILRKKNASIIIMDEVTSGVDDETERKMYELIRDEFGMYLAFAAINEALGRPPLMFVDLRPFGPPMVIVRDHEIAEQIIKPLDGHPYSLPKMPSVYSHMVHVTGRSSILPSHSEHWKQLRRRFNPGFAPQHLITMLPEILDRSLTFINRLEDFDASGQPFSLIHLTANLTFDIITSITMDSNFGAQAKGQPGDFISIYHELFRTYTSEQIDLPWFLTPRLEWKRRQLAKQVRVTLKEIVLKAFCDRRKGSVKSRSVLSQSLQDMEGDTLTEQALDEVCDQLSTFLFAGHDTTSIALSWMFYELSRSPHALQALRNELDGLFGPDLNPRTVREKLLSPDGQLLLYRMPYASAVFKETLRLWPPAGTARFVPPGLGMTVKTASGEEYSLDGLHVYNCATIIQRDPAIYGDSSDDFVPERWLEGGSEIPVTAWRGFERGPRNCIGQELAMLEAKVVIALVGRYVDFIKVGLGSVSLDKAGKPALDRKGQYKVEQPMYPTRQVTPKPVDGMMMKAHIRH
ncbi:hypothetical protein N0V93_004619 [Gnomoniopsis smithogilvyi]|uniref:Cytochrome P450 n=1 Tax=Gnomoniopsis smithogilvyi TaxID=1191159 RepID=A0A9W8YSX4_9PEZI|nr:hypothetical protein N0V93_004619 [Gnomoniopsis smithogilvyi]